MSISKTFPGNNLGDKAVLRRFGIKHVSPTGDGGVHFVFWGRSQADNLCAKQWLIDPCQPTLERVIAAMFRVAGIPLPESWVAVL